VDLALPRRVLPQPTPNIYPGGDCGACVLSGLLRLGSVADAYDYKDGKREPFLRSEMYSALWQAKSEGKIDRVCDAVPIFLPFGGLDNAAFGLPAHCASLDWFRYIRMAFDAGYYGIAQVSHDLKGVAVAETNHWVLLCGWRERRVPHPTVEGAASIEQEILISDSARSTAGEHWVEKDTFLRDWGGYSALLARPTP
jgi:hypothetical protein